MPFSVRLTAKYTEGDSVTISIKGFGNCADADLDEYLKSLQVAAEGWKHKLGIYRLQFTEKPEFKPEHSNCMAGKRFTFGGSHTDMMDEVEVTAIAGEGTEYHYSLSQELLVSNCVED